MDRKVRCLEPKLTSTTAAYHPPMSILSDVDLAHRARHYQSRRVRQTDPLENYGALLTAALFPSFAACCGVYGFGSTFAPGASASWPVTTTVSSGSTPLSIT